MNKPILVLDFDGVLHGYEHGWEGAGTVLDPPVPGAMEFLRAAVKKFEVYVLSARSGDPYGLQAMQGWLSAYLQRELGFAPGAETFNALTFPTSKPPGTFLTLDDRALQFTGTWPEVEELLAFKPWHRREERGER